MLVKLNPWLFTSSVLSVNYLVERLLYASDVYLLPFDSMMSQIWFIRKVLHSHFTLTSAHWLILINNKSCFVWEDPWLFWLAWWCIVTTRKKTTSCYNPSLSETTFSCNTCNTKNFFGQCNWTRPRLEKKKKKRTKMYKMLLSFGVVTIFLRWRTRNVN